MYLVFPSADGEEAARLTLTRANPHHSPELYVHRSRMEWAPRSANRMAVSAIEASTLT